MKKRAADLRVRDSFEIATLDDFGEATRITLTALTVTTVTPVCAPRDATTRIWADSGRPLMGPGAGNVNLSLVVSSDVEFDVVTRGEHR